MFIFKIMNWPDQRGSIKNGHHQNVIKRQQNREKWTHLHLSEFLIRRYHGVCGFRVRSIERLCADNIHRTSRLNDAELDQICENGMFELTFRIVSFVFVDVLCDDFFNYNSQVSPSYGRKTMTGFLRTQGIH